MFLHLLKTTAIVNLLILFVLASEQSNKALSGGSSTVFLNTSAAFSSNTPEMPTKNLAKFTFGNRLFNTLWVEKPASVKAFDGLGPLFNRSSCSGCHLRDGRGQPPANLSEMLSSMLIRISSKEKTHLVYGEQIQNNANFAVKGEIDFRIKWSEQQNIYPDGTPYSLRSPQFIINSQYYSQDTIEQLQLSARVAPAVFGLGLLEAISEEDILINQDIYDGDKNGVSGQPNYTWDIIKKNNAIGRFGWKAGMPSIMQQNAKAAQEDIGLTNFLFPQENYTKEQEKIIKKHIPKDTDLDISQEFLVFLESYIRNLAVPARRNLNDPDVIEGEKIFKEIGCANCHTITFKTSISPISYLNNQTIHPYTDLLLHDMGDGLADNRMENIANGKEWRTPPLWGIGLQKVVNKHTFFLHDGRARNIEEAILWHNGEAKESKLLFQKKDKINRQQLIIFLESL